MEHFSHTVSWQWKQTPLPHIPLLLLAQCFPCCFLTCCHPLRLNSPIPPALSPCSTPTGWPTGSEALRCLLISVFIIKPDAGDEVSCLDVYFYFPVGDSVERMKHHVSLSVTHTPKSIEKFCDFGSQFRGLPGKSDLKSILNVRMYWWANQMQIFQHDTFYCIPQNIQGDTWKCPRYFPLGCWAEKTSADLNKVSGCIWPDGGT